MDLLFPYFRQPRYPLPSWAQRLAAKLESCKLALNKERTSVHEAIVDCFNEAALIEVHYGRRDHAQILCASAIDFIARSILRTDCPSLCHLAFQPLINEARLDRLMCRWDEALAKFDLLRAFRCGRPVMIGVIPIDDSHAKAIIANHPEFRDRCLTNYCIETVVTLVRARRHAAVIEFVGAQATDYGSEPLLDLFREATLLALDGLGQTATALELADKYARLTAHPNAEIFACRHAELLTLSGNRKLALKLCGRLRASILANSDLGGLNLRLLDRLATLLLDLRPIESIGVIEKGLQASEYINDVVHMHQFSSLLAEAPISAFERTNAKSHSQNILTDAWYSQAESDRESMRGHSVIDDLYHQLLLISDRD